MQSTIFIILACLKTTFLDASGVASGGGGGSNSLGQVTSNASLSDKPSSGGQQVRPELPYYFQAERLVLEELLTLASTSSSNQGPPRGGGGGGGGGRRHIRVVTVVAPPFMMKRIGGRDNSAGGGTAVVEQLAAVSSGPGRQPVEWYGYCMDFFEELLKHLPYETSYEIYEAPDGKFGSKLRSHSRGMDNATSNNYNNNMSQPHPAERERWSGMIGELAMGRAHLALAPISVMAERELVVDFTVPFYDLVGIQILLKRPEVPRDWFKFLTVLDNQVWLSITLAYLATASIIYLFDRLSPYSHKNMRRIERVRAQRQQQQQQRPRQRQRQSSPTGLPLATATAGESSGETLLLSSLSSLSAGSGRPPPMGLEVGSEMRGALSAPPFVVYPLARPDSGAIRAISGVTPENGGDNAATDVVGQSLLATSKRRRPSRDYLDGLRTRHNGDGDGGSRRDRKWTSAQVNHGQRVGAERHEAADLDWDDEDDEDDEDGRPDFNLRDSLWFCITSLTPQGGGEAPQNLSGRIVAGAWWLFCFIVIASYTANLAAFLAVSRLEIPIDSLDDLAKQYRIKYAPVEGTAEQSFFERMANIEEIFYNIWKEMSLNDSLSENERSKLAVWDYPISDKYTRIWAQIQEVQMPASLKQAIARVKSSTLDDGFALLGNANAIKFATMTDCSFRAVGDEFSRKPIALALEKGQETLRDDLSYAILQLINRRHMEVLREKWWTNNPARVACDIHDESAGISIENIGGVFIIILAGVLLSFLVWAGERLLYSTKLEVSHNLLGLNNLQADDDDDDPALTIQSESKC